MTIVGEEIGAAEKAPASSLAQHRALLSQRAVSSHTKKKEQISCAVNSQSCSSLSKRQFCPIQK